MLAPDEVTSMLGEPRSRSAFSHPFFFSGFSYSLLMTGCSSNLPMHILQNKLFLSKCA